MGLLSRTKERITHLGVREEYAGKNWREVNAERQDKLRAEAMNERRAKQENRAATKAREKAAYAEAFHQARIERARRRGKMAGSTTIGENVVRNLSRPQASRQVSGRRPRPISWDNPFSMPQYRQPKQKHGGQRYAVVGGKAYPVAGHGKHHKHKPKSKNVDLFPNPYKGLW